MNTCHHWPQYRQYLQERLSRTTHTLNNVGYRTLEARHEMFVILTQNSTQHKVINAFRGLHLFQSWIDMSYVCHVVSVKNESRFYFVVKSVAFHFSQTGNGSKIGSWKLLQSIFIRLKVFCSVSCSMQISSRFTSKIFNYYF